MNSLRGHFFLNLYFMDARGKCMYGNHSVSLSTKIYRFLHDRLSIAKSHAQERLNILAMAL